MTAIGDHPVKVLLTSMFGLGASTIQSLTIYVQFGIAVFSLILLVLTICLKVREYRRGSK